VIDFRDLVKTGLHFGHQTSRWNPKMAPYIWGHRGGIHLVDVSKTAHYLERGAKFLESVAAEGKQVLWVGTKKSAQKSINKWAKELKMPYVTNRWIGGTLTNFPQVKKSVTKLLHFEDIIDRSGEFPYTKKELLTFQRVVDRLQKNIGGIRNLKWPIGAIVVIDVRKEKTVLKEARQAGIPVVALVDTNCDPTLVDYVIPGNDDSPKAVSFIVDYLGEAVKRGIEEAAKKKKEAPKDEKIKEAVEGKIVKAKDAAKKIVKKVTTQVTKKEVVPQSVSKTETKAESKKDDLPEQRTGEEGEAAPKKVAEKKDVASQQVAEKQAVPTEIKKEEKPAEVKEAK